MEVLTDGAERYLALRSEAQHSAFEGLVFESAAFAGLPEEIRLRLLQRAINRFGHEGAAELGKVEVLLGELDRAWRENVRGGRGAPGHARLKRTLAGALISLAGSRIVVEPAPRRRGRMADRGD